MSSSQVSIERLTLSVTTETKAGRFFFGQGSRGDSGKPNWPRQFNGGLYPALAQADTEQRCGVKEHQQLKVDRDFALDGFLGCPPCRQDVFLVNEYDRRRELVAPKARVKGYIRA